MTFHIYRFFIYSETEAEMEVHLTNCPFEINGNWYGISVYRFIFN